MQNYVFDGNGVDVKSLVHLINLHLGDNVIGAELGVYRAQSTCTLLQNCPSIKTLYAIDSYKPYSDFLILKNDGQPIYTVDEKGIEFIRLTALHNIKYSGHSNKIVFMEEDSSLACKKINDELLDFIFIDTYMSFEQAYKDLCEWYPKVRTGGIFSGHDYDCIPVQEAVSKFRIENGIVNKMSVFDKTWVWIK